MALKPETFAGGVRHDNGTWWSYNECETLYRWVKMALPLRGAVSFGAATGRGRALQKGA
ncbi:hypothetical protein KCP70_09220 [Salmonella enterica subsp. enterica]|nr:hypothetical protein KCP70_09220 [Salmonella enterica subsp. enterica]